MSNKVAGNAGHKNAYQTGHHEAVVKNEFADMSSAGAVKTNAGQVGRISGQKEIRIAGRNKGKHQQWVHADIKGDRHDNGNGSRLRVNQLGG